LHDYYENYLKDTVTLTRGKLDQMKNQVEASRTIETKLEMVQNKLNFVRKKYGVSIEEIQEIQSNVESRDEEIYFLRNKYIQCIKESEGKNDIFGSNLNPNFSKVKAAQVIKENYDLIRNSYSFADVTFELADNQVLEVHRHILEGELHIL
jgi:hypothetical protein